MAQVINLDSAYEKNSFRVNTAFDAEDCSCDSSDIVNGRSMERRVLS